MTAAWRQVAFNDALVDVSKTAPVRLTSDDYLKSGSIPIIDQGSKLVGGYWDRSEDAVKVTNPLIIFGDHTKALKFVNFDFCVGAEGVKILEPRRGFDANFVFQFLRTIRLPELGYSRHFKYLQRVIVPKPPLEEQRRIAAILDQADDLRRKRRLALEKLDALPQAIFQEMFGDELSRGRFCSLESIIDDTDRINYGVVQPGTDVSGGTPLVRVANIVSNDFRLESLRRISAAVESQYKRSRLRGFEILVACVGSVGAVALATPDYVGFNIARAVARIPVDAKRANRVYIAAFLKLPQTQRYFVAQTRTVAQPTLNIKQLAETPILDAPRDSQDKYAERIAAVDDAIGWQRQHLERCDQLFASIQHHAFADTLTLSTIAAKLAPIEQFTAPATADILT